MKFLVATAQFSLTKSWEKNLEKAIGYLKEVEEGSLVLLPEMFFCGYEYERLEEFSEISEEVLERLKEVSSERKLLVCGTLPERTAEGIRNTAYLIQDGNVIGKRSKMKLFPIFDEDKHLVPGKENPVFETKFGKVGILICFELRFTDLILDLKRKGTQVVLVPAQWGYARKEHLDILSRARAIELQSYLLVSNIWGQHLETVYAGSSGIYSPWGEVLAFSEKGDTLLKAEADLDYVEEIRRRIPVSIE